MGYLNRVWMAASVAVVQGHSHTDHGHKLKSGVKSLQQVKKRFDVDLLRPLSGSDLSGVISNRDGGDERRLVAVDDSLKQVMYLNCWGQN